MIFYFDTADVDYMQRVIDDFNEKYPEEWNFLPDSIGGVTTNPNAMSKVNCYSLDDTLDQVNRIADFLTSLTNGLPMDIHVQMPNSHMRPQETYNWLLTIQQLQESLDKDDMNITLVVKVPPYPRILNVVSNQALTLQMTLNVTGIADWATIYRVLDQPAVRYASLIPGRMEEVGLDANQHMEYLELLGTTNDATRAVIAGSMRTFDGLKNSIMYGLVPTIGTRIWDQVLEGPGATGWELLNECWSAEFPQTDAREHDFCPTIVEKNLFLSVSFFEQMDELGRQCYDDLNKRFAQ